MATDTLSLPQWAAAQGVSRQLAHAWANAGRIAGAVQVGRYWRIPADAPRPVDGGVGGRGKRAPEAAAGIGQSAQTP